MKVFIKMMCIAFIILSYTSCELIDSLDDKDDKVNNVFYIQPIPESELLNVISKLINAKKNKDRQLKENEYQSVIIKKTNDLRKSLGDVYKERDDLLRKVIIYLFVRKLRKTIR